MWITAIFFYTWKSKILIGKQICKTIHAKKNKFTTFLLLLSQDSFMSLVTTWQESYWHVTSWKYFFGWALASHISPSLSQNLAALQLRPQWWKPQFYISWCFFKTKKHYARCINKMIFSFLLNIFSVLMLARCYRVFISVMLKSPQ